MSKKVWRQEGRSWVLMDGAYKALVWFSGSQWWRWVVVRSKPDGSYEIDVANGDDVTRGQAQKAAEKTIRADKRPSGIKGLKVVGAQTGRTQCRVPNVANRPG